MDRILPVAAVAALLALAACSSGSTPAPPSSVAATSHAVAAPASPDPTLGPLSIGHFPATTNGRLAKGLCEAWSGLRAQYASNVVNDSPVQLNQWFSGPDWATPRGDADKLGNAPAYTSLEAAYGLATLGDTAGIPNAEALDRACAKG